MSWLLIHPSLKGWRKCISCGYCIKEETVGVSKQEILMGRDVEYPLSSELEDNLNRLFEAVNKLRIKYGKPMIVSSGYRPGHYNSDAHGAKNSSHITCEAVDFKDVDGELKTFCTVDILEECGLWMEDPEATKTWCHVSIRPTKNRIFKP